MTIEPVAHETLNRYSSTRSSPRHYSSLEKVVGLPLRFLLTALLPPTLAGREFQQRARSPTLPHAAAGVSIQLALSLRSILQALPRRRGRTTL